ncbi:hypothetical protein EVAR_101990_1 [Eumeta japonica]|uniref:Uncharacterized protein n=1 Tax=Eumeta variegata TaxID=151549 RepID=A0A4C1TSK1_EUMVA|nr:hypothetical protein EVAR_101990_1 [Eumeta japonica]
MFIYESQAITQGGTGEVGRKVSSALPPPWLVTSQKSISSRHVFEYTARGQRDFVTPNYETHEWRSGPETEGAALVIIWLPGSLHPLTGRPGIAVPPETAALQVDSNLDDIFV